MTPNPPAEIPEFLVTRFEDCSPETLRAIGAHVRTERRAAPDTIPDTIVESLALQSELTLEAIGSYVEDVAEYVEQRDGESLAAVTDSDEDDVPWGHQQILNWHDN